MGGYAAIAQGLIGAVQAGVSAANASKLSGPQKNTVSPELRLAYNMSRRRADEGYSTQEKAAFNQMLARRETSAKRMFQNAGLAGIGSAAAGIMNIDALNKFAANGASIKRQNFGQFAGLAGQIDQVGQMETNRFNTRLLQEEQALGAGVKAGIGNMFGGLQSGMNYAQNENAIASYGDMFNGGGQGGGQNPLFKPNSGGGVGNTFTPSQTPNYQLGQVPTGANQQYAQFMFPGNQHAYVPPPPPFGAQGYGAATNYSQIWGGQ